MKHILYIEKHDYINNLADQQFYYSVSSSKTNKNWIVQYNTSLDQIIHYCMGYIDANESFYENVPRFSHNIDLSGYPELELYKITEKDFQNFRGLN